MEREKKDDKTRIIKPTSFSTEDEFESDLLAFATDPARGKKGQFGPYVKQLIERDRDGWVRTVNVSPIITAHVSNNDEDSDAAGGYL